MSASDDPDVVKSVLRRERDGDEWVAFEPAGDTTVVGRGETELAAAADYIDRLRERNHE